MKNRSLKSRLSVYSSVLKRDVDYLVNELKAAKEVADNIRVATVWGDTVNLINSDGFMEGVRLVYMCNMESCPSCANEIIKVVKNSIETNNLSNKIMIIGKYDTRDVVNNYKKFWGNDYVYGFVDYSFSGISSIDRPFFLLLDNSCQIRNVFIPDATFPQKISAYLKTYSELL